MPVIRWKQSFLMICFLTVLMILLLKTNIRTPPLRPWIGPKLHLPLKDTDDASQDLIRNDTSQFIVDTPTCQLPATALWPKFYANNWNWRANQWPNCSEDVKLARLSDDDLLLELNVSNLTNVCHLVEVLRDPKSDNSYLLKNKRVFNQTTLPVANMEMMLINCSKALNFDAAIPLKKSVLEKVQYWSQKPEKPINVLMIGFDSTSRLHMLRGLPQTMDVLEELGFISFEGYHTIEPSTLPNFMAMLMGQTETQVRFKCAPDWGTPFDKCPIIWKEFSEQKYVTVFNEDGTGTFNWGGQSGFKTNPTDYYLHPLLKALNTIRQRQGKTLEAEQCVSSEGVPAFMIRYLRRFLKKFHSTPFFIFDYHTNPFHDSQFAIPNIDEDLAAFFHFIKSMPELMENTLIILMNDHGDRYNFFSYDSMESYLERALPGLFIRIPDGLQRAHPEFKEGALKNTHLLTTPFDVHHTLLHTLSLSGFPVSGNETFNPILYDRSSLFIEVPNDRTCDTVHVGLGFCVCNTAAESKAISNPFFVDKLIDYGIEQLNAFVQQSNYNKICEKWERSEQSLISAHVLAEHSTFRDILLKFTVSPSDSQFSVKLRVSNDSSSGDVKIEMQGKFSRINSYGEQSWCVERKTAEDKVMKELCFCLMQYDDES